jgi:tRNA threonylcarbamoyladenosine biosynthesis protein TsaE
MQLVYSLYTVTNAAQQVYDAYKDYRVWTFPSAMGSGKTTFIATLCKQILACADAVSSPTYSIINIYQSPTAGSVCHMDWYRLKDEQEAIDAGVEDALYTYPLCLVEWPSIVPQLLPPTYVEINIDFISETERLLKVQTVHTPNRL